MKRFYIGLIKILRVIFHYLGILTFLEKRMEHSRWARWLRSLFAIYDIDDLVKLDMPWWNIEAIDWVASYLKGKSNVRVFEYGSGASTIWLAKRCSNVTTIEHDAVWADSLKERLASIGNVTLKVIPPNPEYSDDEKAYLSVKGGWTDCSFKEYVNAIHNSNEMFDVIVIDGRARAACLHEARNLIADDGIIIFDNAGRKRYQAGISETGMEQVRFSGLTACLPYADQTYILQKAPVSRDGT